MDLDECIKNIRCPGGFSQTGGHTADEVRSPITQESGMPGEDLSQMEPQPGQVGWADDSIEIIANPGEEGQGDGLPQEGDVYAPGGPQQEHDVRAEGGRGVPRVMVSGLVDNQNQPGEEFGRINIKKLISN